MDLNEAVVIESPVDLLQNRVGQPLRAKQHGDGEVVRFGSQFKPLGAL